MNHEFPKEYGGRFVIKNELARRSTGTVFVAEDKTLDGMEVALKIFAHRVKESPDTIADFEREVKLLQAASHPALVPVVAGGAEDGWLYLAMELVKGGTLKDLLSDLKGAMDPGEAINTAAELAAGLGELHKHGIAHGHLDSRAILFRNMDPRLAGFCPGAIDRTQAGMTSSGRIVAEPAYMAPEQVNSSSPVGPRTDIYSLSVLLFEMVTGKRPFAGTTPIQTAMLHVTQQPPSASKIRPEISPLLDAAIYKGLSKDPSQRFATCEEFREAITAGQKVTKNPFAEAKEKESAGTAPASFGTETIAVSMSTESIRELLSRAPAEQKAEPKTAAPVNGQAANGPAVPKFSPQPLPGATETAMGMNVTDLLPGTLLVVDGAMRGERFSLTRPQTMIGSDPGCDIRIAGRGVPNRYALVIQRGSKFYAASLSGTPVVVNGRPLEADEEAELQRGDIVTAGDEKLRFVAPGEVFTLQQDVADRVIDRPKSRIPKILAASVGAVAAISVTLIYLYSDQAEQQRVAKEKERIAKEQQREEAVRNFIRQGDELFKAGALTLPVGENAAEKFRSVLELNPEQSYAKRRLADIETRMKELGEERLRSEQLSQRVKQYLNDGDAYFQARAYISPPGKNARESYQQALKLDPQNEPAQKRVTEIDNILSDQLGRVRETLAKATELKNAGKYAQPPGDNAHELLRQVLDVDPKNSDAREMILDMAARSVYEGDKLKREAKSLEMKQAYLNAKLLGVDPAFIANRLQGVELMKKSSASVMIIDRKTEPKPEGQSSGEFLDTADIERRITNLTLTEDGGNKGGKTFIDLSKRR